MKRDTFLLNTNSVYIRDWIFKYLRERIGTVEYYPNEKLRAMMTPQYPIINGNSVIVRTSLTHENLEKNTAWGYWDSFDGFEFTLTPIEENRTEVEASYNGVFSEQYQGILDAISKRWVIQWLSKPDNKAQIFEPWIIIQEKGMTPSKRGKLKTIWELREKGETWQIIAGKTDFSETTTKKHYQKMKKLMDS